MNLTWNANQRQNQNGSKTTEFFGKWVNYHDGKQWAPVDLSPVDQTSRLSIEKAGYNFFAPKFADGPFRFESKNLFDTETKTFRTDPVSGKTKTFTDAKHVPANVTSKGIEYIGAFPSINADLVIVLHEQKVKYLTRFNSLPPGIGPVLIPFTMDVDSSLAPDFSPGQQTLNRDFSFGKNSFRYVRTERPKVWDSARREAFISVIGLMRGNVFTGQKVIPRAYLKNATYPVYTDTTDSFFASSGDGQITMSNATFSTMRGGTGTQVSIATNNTEQPIYLDGTFQSRHLYFPFDTSSISASDAVSAASFSAHHTYDGSDHDDFSTGIGLLKSAQASKTALAYSDWVPASYTEVASRKTVASITGATGTYTWTLTDFTCIAKGSGFTPLMLMVGKEIDNSAPGSGNASCYFDFSEQGGTSLDPSLSVTHAVFVAPLHRLLLLGCG